MRECGQGAADEREEASCIEYGDTTKDVAELSKQGICSGEGQQIGYEHEDLVLECIEFCCNDGLCCECCDLVEAGEDEIMIDSSSALC